MRMALMAIVLATGCGRAGAKEAVAAYEAAVQDARALVEAHEQAVRDAGAMGEVDALEQAYRADWEGVHEQMQQHMDDIGGCAMHGDGMSMMGEAGMTMGDMDGAVADHMETHGAHGDLQECRDAEQDHLGMMSGWLDDMDGHGEHWLGQGMTCPGMGMGAGMWR